MIQKPLVSSFACFECFFPALHDRYDGFNNGLSVNASALRDSGFARAWCIQNNDLFSIPSNHYIWVVSRHDNLTLAAI
jgi:hypothetical protein